MAGIEQRLDLLSPLQNLMQKVGDSLKQALPQEATVKIELETTPLQEVEASIARTREQVPSAASTLEGARGPSGATATAQEDYDKALTRIDAIGSRLGYLLSKIAEGKDATGNAAMEAERLRDSLEKVAEKGREAAKSLGKDGLASKIDEAEKAAGQGQGGKPSGGGDVNVGSLVSMIRNPQGAAMQGIEMTLQKMLGGGGGGGVLMGTLGLAAAAAGGVYGGWKVNDNLTKEASADAAKAVSDMALANSISHGKFDFRGTFYDEDRFGPRGAYRNQDERLFSNQEVRRVLGSMNIGMDNFKSSPGMNIGDPAMAVSLNAYRMGASTDQVAGMVGAQIRSGAMDAADYRIYQYLGEIAGSTAEAAKQGVSTNEHLTVISTLNAKSVSETGMLTSSSSRLNMQAAAALGDTGQAALKGQEGQNALSVLAGNGGDDARAREIGMMLDEHGNLKPEYMEMVKSNPYLVSLMRENGPVVAANALLDDPTLRAGVNQLAIRLITSGGGNSLNAGRLMGVGSGSMSRDAIGIYGAGLEANDIISRKIIPDAMGTVFDSSTARGKEERDALAAVYSSQQRGEVRDTGYTYEAAKNLNEAATKLNAVSDNLGKALAEGKIGDAVLGMNPLTMVPYWGAKALH